MIGLLAGGDGEDQCPFALSSGWRWEVLRHNRAIHRRDESAIALLQKPGRRLERAIALTPLTLTAGVDRLSAIRSP